MTWSLLPSDKARHLVLRASSGETLPDGLVARLRDEQVAAGWLRASGVLRDVELRAFDADVGTLGHTRRIVGPVHVLALEGSIGLAGGEPSFAMRALLARETDRGLETIAGEIASARTVALEVLVTALDDVALGRSLDEAAGVWLVDGGSAAAQPRADGAHPEAAFARSPRPAPVAAAAPPAAPAAWSSALEASDRVEPPRPRPVGAAPAPVGSGAPIPQRPARPPTDFDTVYPEPGDVVEHFAFGHAEVVKSDGDRLHLKVAKDGRIREIALEMLRVARLDDTAEGKRRFKLERRM